MSEIKEYRLKTTQGLELNLLNYGARVRSINVPTKDKCINVALGYPTLKSYLSDEFYLGASIGRFCNRIHGGEIYLNAEKFSLSINEVDNSNTLHGGFKGFDKYYWEVTDYSDQFIVFKILSPHLDQGFPGNLDVQARFSVDKLSFDVEYSATCDQDTVVNLCNHTYFNLDGFTHDSANDIKNHQLLVKLDKFLQLNDMQVPSGVLQDCRGTPFDFSYTSTHLQGRKISTALVSEQPQIELVGGLDHTFIKKAGNENIFQKVAQLYSSKSNIALQVFTTQAGVHIYSGNHLMNKFNKHAGICFETQGYPDSPNHKHFPNTVLKAGDTYHHKTTYQFDLLK